MGWLMRRRARPADAPMVIADEGDFPEPPFVCADCGRTDLPEAGGWEPPICEECDAAINEDALYEAGAYDDA